MGMNMAPVTEIICGCIYNRFITRKYDERSDNDTSYNEKPVSACNPSDHLWNIWKIIPLSI